MLVFIPGPRLREWNTDPFILNWALLGCEWSTSRPGRLNSGERTPCTHSVWGRGVPEPALAFCPSENLTPDRQTDKPSQCTHDCHIPAITWRNIRLNRVTATVKTSSAPEACVEMSYWNAIQGFISCKLVGAEFRVLEVSVWISALKQAILKGIFLSTSAQMLT